MRAECPGEDDRDALPAPSAPLVIRVGSRLNLLTSQHFCPNCGLSPYFISSTRKRRSMQGPMRGLLAGVAAWKLGGGCISTILIFILVFWMLGYVNC